MESLVILEYLEIKKCRKISKAKQTELNLPSSMLLLSLGIVLLNPPCA